MADDITILDSVGVTQTLRAYDLGSKKHQIVALPGDYETIAASTTKTLGATGAVGDYLVDLVVVPLTTSPGAVTLKDGSLTAVTVFAGGTSSVSNLVPFSAVRGLRSENGAWQITTLTNVVVWVSGKFT